MSDIIIAVCILVQFLYQICLSRRSARTRKRVDDWCNARMQHMDYTIARLSQRLDDIEHEMIKLKGDDGK